MALEMLLRDWCRWMGLNAYHSLLLLGIPEDCAEDEFQEAVRASLSPLGRCQVLGKVFRKELGTMVALVEFDDYLNRSVIPQHIPGKGGPWRVVCLPQVPNIELEGTLAFQDQFQGPVLAGRAGEAGATAVGAAGVGMAGAAGVSDEAAAPSEGGSAVEAGGTGESGMEPVTSTAAEAGAAGVEAAGMVGVSEEVEGLLEREAAAEAGALGDSGSEDVAGGSGEAAVEFVAGAAGQEGAAGRGGAAGEEGRALEAGEETGAAGSDEVGAGEVRMAGYEDIWGKAAAPREGRSPPDWVRKWKNALQPMLENLGVQELRPFSGQEAADPEEEPFEVWVEHAYDIMYLWRHLSENEKKRRLVDCLSGPALDVLCTLLAEDPSLSMQECLVAMVQVFGTQDSCMAAQISFLTCTQEPQEPLFDFVMRLEGLLQTAVEKGAVQPSVADKVRVRQVLTRGRPNLMLYNKLMCIYLEGWAPDFLRMLQLIHEWEDMMDLEKSEPTHDKSLVFQNDPDGNIADSSNEDAARGNLNAAGDAWANPGAAGDNSNDEGGAKTNPDNEGADPDNEGADPDDEAADSHDKGAAQAHPTAGESDVAIDKPGSPTVAAPEADAAAKGAPTP